MSEEFDYDYEGVFTDHKAAETLRKSAEALGINPNLVAPKEGAETQYKYYAHGGCKRCWGRGVINICISPSKQKVFWHNEGVPGRISKRKSSSRHRAKKSQPRRKVISGISLANGLDEQWNTRQPEPYDYRANNTTRSLCSCVRMVEI